LWGLTFGGGGLAGDVSSLYFTAGTNGETHGLFGKITLATNGATDFQFGVNQQSVTVPRGGSGTVMLTVSGGAGFDGEVTLSCPAAPAGITCTFTPNPVAPGAQDVNSMLTVSVNSGYLAQNHRAVPFAGFGALAFVFFGVPLRVKLRKVLTASVVICVLALAMLFQAACNSGGGSTIGGGGNEVPLTVTATSGGLSHSTIISVSVQ
jgi:hypothetical protein